MKSNDRFSEIMKSCISEKLSFYIKEQDPIVTLRVNGLDYMDLYQILLEIYSEQEVKESIERGHKSYWCELAVDRMGMFLVHRAIADDRYPPERNMTKLKTHYDSVSHFIDDINDAIIQTEILVQ